ncbi:MULTISPECIES: PP2C family serine/threonine-protein phosphatase [unclassified Microcoleus]|uniref:PP2C family serine/threonine-protein phosphatase n=1 Tax=unclassified Microcoleus TaxID=2642155 RepID=UPI002FD3E13C
MEIKNKLEELIKAVSWKLYVEHQSLTHYKETWDSFSHEKSFQQQMKKLCLRLEEIFSQMLKYRLGLISIDDQVERKQIELLETLWKRFLEVGGTIDPAKKEDFSKFIRSVIKEVLSSEISSDSDQAAPTGMGTQERKDETVTDNQEQPEAKPTSVRDEGNKNTEPVNQEVSQRDTPPPPSLWKYLPVSDELERHSEYDCKSNTSPDGMKLIGARVRGKSHKHDGTNCDDWFKFTVSNNWTIIAVSDGAGSKKFSRVGARESCEAAVKYLAEQLKQCNIDERTTKEQLSADLNRNANWAFVGEDIESVQKTLHNAMQVAYEAVEEKANGCQNEISYFQVLNKGVSAENGRKLEVRDFSCTLLLAVHTTVKVGGTECSLVLTCQIGDGMLAAISQEGKLKLLGKPDSGDYGGQTEFLTSKNKLEKENLVQKTFVFPGNLKALMVMTDGVADDYFPNDPGMLQLYGDLILNQVIEIRKPEESEINKQLEQTELRDSNGVKEAKPKFQIQEEVITKDDIKQVRISYVERYAQELARQMLNVIASPALLWAGAYLGEVMYNESDSMKPEEKLQLWLDSYYRRGSFDDRTLVVLYREEI